MLKEIIEKLNGTPRPAPVLEDIRLVCHVITLNRYDHIKRLLDAESGFFDTIRICDGGSDVPVLELYEQYDCEVYINTWRDDMAAQHNFLLTKANVGDWVCILDDDEVFSQQLRTVVRQHIHNYGSAYTTFRVPSIRSIDGYLDKPIDLLIELVEREEIQPFTKAIIFQYDARQHYSGASHYGLVDEGIVKILPEPIIHFKSHVEMLWADLYQAFIDPKMQGYSQEQIDKLWPLFDNYGIRTVEELHGYLRRGRADAEIASVFKEWKDDVMHSSSHWYQYYYYVLHPEEIEDFELEGNLSLQVFLRELGGFMSYTTPGHPHILPIGHLPMNDMLKKMVGKDYIVLRYRIVNGEVMHYEQ